jgi:hypothetical protein
MANWEFSDDEITTFFSKLDEFVVEKDLTDKERALLRAILLVASGQQGDSTGGEPTFAAEFAAAFRQNHAESIVATYGAGGLDAAAAAFVVKAIPPFVVRTTMP